MQQRQVDQRVRGRGVCVTGKGKRSSWGEVGGELGVTGDQRGLAGDQPQTGTGYGQRIVEDKRRYFLRKGIHKGAGGLRTLGEQQGGAALHNEAEKNIKADMGRSWASH